MPRPVKNRKIYTPPKMVGYKPFGIKTNKTNQIELNFDEFESIKYINYDNLQQEEAAQRMNVSRPTFTRIYQNALKKIATAFVEGMIINIKGGNVEFDKDWYRCIKCYKLIEGLENHKKCNDCELYGNNELKKLDDETILD